MKAAFSCRDDRIAPVFDVSRRILVVEVHAGNVVGAVQEVLPDGPPFRKALRLMELGIGTLVCGAISRQLHEMVAAHGIRVISFVAGEHREIVQAWRDNGLRGGAFAMPGCRGGGPRRLRRGRITSKEDAKMPGNMFGGRGSGGRGREQGPDRGPGTGPGDIGPKGPADASDLEAVCICYQCGRREPHESGLPCRTKVCPRCGGEMGRES